MRTGWTHSVRISFFGGGPGRPQPPGVFHPFAGFSRRVLGALEDHVGEEELLPVLVRPGQVEGAAGFLQHPRLFEAEAAGALVTDRGVSTAVVAYASRVVLPPPAARPAQEVVLREHAPRQAVLAGTDPLGAARVASLAQPLTEVVARRSAPRAARRGEGASGQAVVAEVHAGLAPRDPLALATVTQRRDAQRRILARRWTHSGGSERGLPNRGVILGGAPFWPLIVLAFSVGRWGRRPSPARAPSDQTGCSPAPRRSHRARPAGSSAGSQPTTTTSSRR